ncbi:MAG: MoaD/ThiS family protein [Anaerolineaceae bacterium]|nr:MoaD/ThiS family protein [Anaerolineaceae bacterium]
MIEVRLFATLREGRNKLVFLEPEEINCGHDLLTKLDILPQELAIFLINGLHSSLDTPIHDGDILALFPPVGGG